MLSAVRHAVLRGLFVLGLMACETATQQARAQVPIGVEADVGEAGARRHFDRSLELYRAGRYSDALGELKRAAELDPRGKDLFFNLSLVHEKLGQLPEAITALDRFRELETDPKERERARIVIERLRGAAQAGEGARPLPEPCPSPVPPPAPVPRGESAPPAVLIGAGAVAVTSLLVGTVFGLKALSDDVGDARTSDTLSVEQLRARGRRAEREALVADVALALGVASSATFVSLWLLSPPSHGEARGAGVTLRGYF
jgi:tetratricopeptide (TPR) repeat protein